MSKMTTDTCSKVCCSNTRNSSVQQSLDELDFSRGIWSAALEGDANKVQQFLLKPNADPDVLDSSGYTALHYASRAGHLSVCKLLLGLGANPNKATRAGHSTPLHRAVLKNQSDIARLLLECKADPCIADADGCTPLHLAATSGNSEMCKLLLMSHPDLKHIKNSKNQTALDNAKSPEVVELLQ